MKIILKKAENTFTFEYNNHYAYSCKFIDKKHIDDYVTEIIDDLKYYQYKNINENLIEDFYIKMINYFEKLDKTFEKEGYEYLYEISEEETLETCEANEYYFTNDGEYFAL